MRKKEGLLCRLCLSIVSNDSFEEMGKSIKIMLETLQLKLEFHMGKKHICSNCMGRIQKCLDFKSAYLNTEDFIVSLYNSEINLKLDLMEVYIQKKTHMATTGITRDHQICRFCLELCKSPFCNPLVKIDEDMIQKCVPELNINLTKEPVICNSCLNSLKFYFKFLQNCADTEEKIIKYCKFEAIGSKGPIDLYKVIKFTKNTSECETDITRIKVVYLDESCREYNENRDIKTEVIIKKESAHFDSEDVEKYIKTYVNEDIDKMEIKVESLEQQNGELEMVHGQDDLQASVGIKKEINEYCKLERNNNDGNVVSLDELCCETNENNVKTEVIIKKESTQFVCENEGSYIKTDIDENILKMEIKVDSLEPENEILETIDERNDLQTEQSKFGSFRDAHTSPQTTIKNINTRLHKGKRRSYVAKQKGGLKQHTLSNREYSEVTVHKCDRCSYMSKLKGNLNKHMLTHRDLSEVTTYSCDKCSYATIRKWNLKTHMLTHRKLLEVTFYECDSCSYVTKYKAHLKTHMLTHQELSEITVYRCDECSLVTNSKGNLKRHMLTHRDLTEVTVYSCGECSYVTKYKAYLKKHRLIHRDLSEVTGYRCGECSYVTKTKANFKKHMLIHPEFSEVSVDCTEQYKCHSCSFVTKHKSSLKTHMLTHRDPSEVPIYWCDSCFYITKQKGHLKRHMLVHRDLSEVTGYMCGECSFVTKNKANLKRHMLVHREFSKESVYSTV